MEFTFIILLMMFAHWIFDFLMQTQYMAENKSESWRALTLHTGTYSVGMTLVFQSFLSGSILQQLLDLGSFLLITFVMHTLTDAITSNMTKKAHSQEKYRKMFNIIGFDQFLHLLQILLTLKLLLFL